jgi:hypothetical protein
VQVADDRTGFLGEPRLIETAGAEPIEHGGRAEHLRNSHDAGAADADHPHSHVVAICPSRGQREWRRQQTFEEVSHARCLVACEGARSLSLSLASTPP